MIPSSNDHTAVTAAGTDASPSDSAESHDCPPLISLQARLLDMELMRQVLSGLLKPPPRVTVKGIVEQNLTAIRAARRRGWSIAQIAAELASAGFVINEATLRKYLSQLDKPKTTAPRMSAKQATRPVQTPVAPLSGNPPRRSLRRSYLLTTPVLKPEE